MHVRTLLLCALVLLLCGPFATSAFAQNSISGGEKLQYVIYLSRHGVRSPTGKASGTQVFSLSVAGVASAARLPDPARL